MPSPCMGIRRRVEKAIRPWGGKGSDDVVQSNPAYSRQSNPRIAMVAIRGYMVIVV
jgi:hypothetical protein